MLSITVEHNCKRQAYQHGSGPLWIGALPEFGAGIVVDDMYVSSQQLMLEESAEGRLRFRNLGRNDVTLSTGECFAQGQSGEAALPARLVLTSTVIHVEHWRTHSMPAITLKILIPSPAHFRPALCRHRQCAFRSSS